MADTTKIIFTMNTEHGERKFSYTDANPDATTANVKAAAQALITNGSFFEYPPISVQSATLVTVTEESYDLGD